jgi:hypothetical protein
VVFRPFSRPTTKRNARPARSVDLHHRHTAIRGRWWLKDRSRSRLHGYGAHEMPPNGNLLLASFAASDLASLKPHLKPLHLDQQVVLYNMETLSIRFFSRRARLSPSFWGYPLAKWWNGHGGQDGMLGASASLDSKISIIRLLCSSVAMRWCAAPVFSKLRHFPARPYYPNSFVMNRRFFLRSSSLLLALLRTTRKQGLAVGSFAPVIYQVATPLTSPRNFFPRCSAFGDQVFQW